jgi:hypothetical protein
MSEKNLKNTALESSEPWISKKGYADILKISTNTVDGWMYRYWTLGEHYNVKGRTTFINRKKANKWLGQKE